jgi:hypothetical protein
VGSPAGRLVSRSTWVSLIGISREVPVHGMIGASRMRFLGLYLWLDC